MFRLDDEVLRWRKRLEKRGWFSPSELDELEDHLWTHAEDQELGPAPASVHAFKAGVREQLGEPAALFREFAKSETPVWQPLLLAGWGLYAMSFLLPSFGTVGFEASHPNFRMSVSGWECLLIALTNGWILAVLPNLAMIMTLAALGRARRSIEAWLGRILAVAGASAIGLGAFNLLRPLAIPLDGGLVAHGHLGPAYWTWSASFAVAATALWLRDREWTFTRDREEALA